MKLTVRIERADGQFTVAQTEIVAVPPASANEEHELERKVLSRLLARLS